METCPLRKKASQNDSRKLYFKHFTGAAVAVIVAIAVIEAATTTTTIQNNAERE